ncbi:hypothetical protein [Bacillus sp. 1NLA3E]|uniref:hypothetical protein n=1 Tax=Bacillus sp. 1NLA3E TaxID=666686 RepID=UPI000247F02F|nr:hypothetical protein [Bacillus sp. 1NLA3E]AGK53984.1 hypothetical protein B1NLA3E_11160 [Bacillus sp. 1NLA3E]
MSEYQQFLKERNQIDSLMQSGFKITQITENLNGSIVIFSKNRSDNQGNIIETLQISNANARKYFSAKLIQQQINSKKGD